LIAQATHSSSPSASHQQGDSRIGAVVIGGDYQGLGIVRSLGRRSIPVYVIDDVPSISRFSRYCTRHLSCPPLHREETIVSSLIETAKSLPLDRCVLYPTREELVAAISKHRSELERFYRVPTPEWDVVRWAWDKRNTYQLASKLGVPAPVTHYLTSSAQLGELENLSPPFVIKPAIKEHFIYATRAKAWRADSFAELKVLFEKASALTGPGEVMIQELIPGDGRHQYACCAFFRENELAGKMVVRRRRQFPLQFGRSSTFVETLDLPILEEYAQRFLSAIGYYGLVEMEFKYDSRTSEYKLLDVNLRTWGYHSLGARAGVDFSYMLYADQAGMPVEKCQSRPGLAWIRLSTDLPAAAIGAAQGELKIGPYLRSLLACREEAAFSWDDPIPGFVEAAMIPYLAVKKGF
jgi:predicted ATP-grasp superfamily ATP-dependent carboligase